MTSCYGTDSIFLETQTWVADKSLVGFSFAEKVFLKCIHGDVDLLFEFCPFWKSVTFPCNLWSSQVAPQPLISWKVKTLTLRISAEVELNTWWKILLASWIKFAIKGKWGSWVLEWLWGNSTWKRLVTAADSGFFTPPQVELSDWR